ncbi:hypothetical protein Tco_0475591 [Tanacetum coccineum]
MIDYLSIVETDKVNHAMETNMVKLVVEFESFGMSVDELDKETGSSDGLQPKLVLTEPEVNPTKFGRMTSQKPSFSRRLLESFKEDAKYEHVGQDARSQGGQDDQDKQGKYLEISKSKTKSKDNDKGSRSKITQHEGTSLQHNKDQRFKNLTTKQSQQVQGSKIQDLTSGIRKPHIRGDC